MKLTLRPRDVAAIIVASCSEVTVDIAVRYATQAPDPTTDVQRRIEAAIQLPSPAEQAWLGHIECWFGDGERLSSLGMYGNFAAAESAVIELPRDANLVWLSPPEPGAVETVPCGQTVISIDRSSHAVRLSQAGTQAVEWFALADGLYVGVDDGQAFAGLIVAGIEWISADAV